MLDAAQIAALLDPYTGATRQPEDLYVALAAYLELLLRWNARTNLTAIRDPVEIVLRHFGESLFVARHVGAASSLLDLGSGAGFPGVPIQLAWPTLAVTLAESQSKKAAFLHEVMRTLGLAAEVWPRRVEAMPPTRTFDTVTLRAVDNTGAALGEAARRATGRILLLTTTRSAPGPELLPGFTCRTVPLPESSVGILLVAVHCAPYRVAE